MSPSSSSLSGASAAAAAGGDVGVGGCGGLRVLVLMCCVANLVNAADRVLLPVCMVQMSSHFRWPLSHQGWILSGFGFGYVSSQVVGGKAAVALGGRRVLLLAVFSWSLATFLTPFVAPHAPALIATRVALGLAEGLAMPAIFHIFSHTVPREERGRAFSYLVSFGSVGQMIASLVCPHLMWQTGFLVFGVVGFVWALLWLLYLRSTFHPSCPSPSPPHLLPNYHHQLPPTPKGVSGVHWTEYVSHGSLLAIYCAHFCMNWSNYTLMSWLPTYLTHAFHAHPDHISLTALPFLFNSVAGLVAGHYADYLIARRSWTTLSVRRLMTSLGLLGPAFFTLLFSVSTHLGLAVLFVSVSMALCACNSPGHLSNHVDVAPHLASVTFAVSNTFASIPGITAGPVTAAIVEYSGQWATVFLLSSLLNVLGAAVYMSYSATSQVI